MFATQTNKKAKTAAEGKAPRADAAAGKDSPEPNPVWQSLALRPVAIQPKLAISQPDDPYEREADRVADRVMRMAAPQSGAPQSPNLQSVNTKLPSVAFSSGKIQRKCDHCEEEEEEKKLQRKEGEPQAFGVQMKSLAISAANDPDEKEADEVARKVVTPVEFQTPRQPLIMRQDERKEIKKSTKPEIESWESRNKKGQTISPDNYCASCEGILLGVNSLDPFHFSNGIEMKVNIKNHTADYSYNIKRTFESKYWENTETAKGTEWIQTRNKGKNVGSGTDDRTDDDEYLIPQQNANNPALYHIYSKDRPGLNRQQPQTTRDSREVLMISNFIESLEITDKENKSYVDGTTFKWHTKLWVAWDSELGMWKVIEEKSSIGAGHVGLESPGAEKKVQKKSVEASSPTDPEEKEADEVAHAIVDRWPVKIESRERINRNGSGSAQTTPEFQSQLESSKGNGQSLPREVQIEMGGRMGSDLSDVRVHTGSAADEMSKSLNARAFTLGSDVYFRHGEFNTASKQGKELLAHELVHTRQQAGGLKRQIQLKGIGRRGNDLLGSHDTVWQSLGLHRTGTKLLSHEITQVPASTVQRSEATQALEPTKQPQVEVNTTDHDDACTFQMKIADVEYCFVAKKIDDANSHRFQLTAYAVGGEEKNSVRYTAEIWINTENEKRVIPMLGKIKMISPDKKVSPVLVDPVALAKAWNEQAPAGGSAWEFVVLEVYDESKKELPVRIVYWMGGEWAKLESPKVTPQSKVATFRVARSKFPRGYIERKTLRGKEELPQEEISKLIENESPKSVSAGFDEGTYVGMAMTSHLKEIETGGETGGKQATAKTSFWVSSTIRDAPNVIKANFKSNESALPGGLDATSVARFKDEVRQVLLYLQETSEVDVEIRAYTDTVGTAEENCTLSQARADSAKKYLTDATVWTGAGGTPKALDPSRIIMAQGEGQTLAEEHFKTKHPEEWKKLKSQPDKWKKLIGSKEAAEEVSFRKFEITYKLR